MLVLDRIWNSSCSESCDGGTAGEGFENDVREVVLGKRSDEYVGCGEQSGQLIFFFDEPDADCGERRIVGKGCLLGAKYDDSRRFAARDIPEGQQRLFEMMKPLSPVGRGAKRPEKDERSVRWQAEG